MTTTTKTAPTRKTVKATTTRASNKQTQTKQQKKEEQRTKMNQEQMMKKKKEVAIRQLQRWSRTIIWMAKYKPPKHTVASNTNSSPTKSLPCVRVNVETVNVVTPTKSKSPASEEAVEVQRRSRQQSRARHTTTVTNDGDDDDDDETMATKEPHRLATTTTNVVVTSHSSSSPTHKKRKLSQLSHTNNSPSRHSNVRMGLTVSVALVAMTRSSYKSFLVSNQTGTRNISTSSSTTTRLWEKVPSHLQTKFSSSVNDLSARSRLLLSQIGMSKLLDAETLWKPTTSSKTSSRKKQRMTTTTTFSQTTTEQEHEHEPTTTTTTMTSSRSAAIFQKMKELTESVLDDL
eukprot:scaffold17183_cov57-Attheya_sp.AAC.2